MNPPSGVKLSGLAEQVFAELAKVTAFPWPVLQSQCRRCDLDPAVLDVRGLRALLPHLVTSVSRFTSEGKAEMLRRELEALVAKPLTFRMNGNDGN